MSEGKNSGKHCIVCDGAIIIRIEQKFNAMMGAMVIGPGSEGQFYSATKYHCDWCGLEYYKLPKDGKCTDL